MKTFKVTYTLVYVDGNKEEKETTIQLKKWDDDKAISEVFWKKDWDGDVYELILETKQEIK